MTKEAVIEQSDSFGNYLIHGIDEIILPAAISWWPNTIGWQLVAFLLAAFSIRHVYLKTKIWWSNRYRREVVAKLNEFKKYSNSELVSVVEQLPFYLKTTALQAYPRDQVAQLSGHDWVDFLNDKYGSILFTEHLSEQLITVSYRPKSQWQLSDQECLNLIDTAIHWVKHHV